MYPKRGPTSQDLLPTTMESPQKIHKSPRRSEPSQVAHTGPSLLDMVNMYIELGFGSCMEDMKQLKKVLETQQTMDLMVKTAADVSPNTDPNFDYDSDESFECSCGMISCSEDEEEQDWALGQTSPLSLYEADKEDNSTRENQI